MQTNTTTAKDSAAALRMRLFGIHSSSGASGNTNSRDVAALQAIIHTQTTQAQIVLITICILQDYVFFTPLLRFYCRKQSRFNQYDCWYGRVTLLLKYSIPTNCYKYNFLYSIQCNLGVIHRRYSVKRLVSSNQY